MKFYSREKELILLEKQYKQSQETSSMTVITGRRRIGKTFLSLKYVENKKYLYFFISKKSEVLLCKEFIDIIKSTFDYPIHGEITDFRIVFRILLEIAMKERFVVIIDEFQEFYNINQSVYSDIQNLWDQFKHKTKVHMIFIGSIYSLMHKIFESSQEPLFGRADRIMYLKPLPPSIIRQILIDNNSYSKENLFFIYLITGGIPRYLDILTTNQVFSKEEIIEFYFDENSPFLDEGKSILIEEFGKEYGTYFSILEMLSEGRTSRSEIESILEKNIGGYLEKLETDYDIISKRKPIGAKSTGKIQKYFIKDNFIMFWFRYVYKNRSAVENNKIDFIHRSIEKSLPTYNGIILEKLYQELFIEKKDFNVIGNYWERGNINEIDLVAINELDKKMIIAEIKMNVEKIRKSELITKSEKLLSKYKGYEVEYLLLGMQTLEDYL